MYSTESIESMWLESKILNKHKSIRDRNIATVDNSTTSAFFPNYNNHLIFTTIYITPLHSCRYPATCIITIIRGFKTPKRSATTCTTSLWNKRNFVRASSILRVESVADNKFYHYCESIQLQNLLVVALPRRYDKTEMNWLYYGILVLNMVNYSQGVSSPLCISKLQ